MNKVTISLLSFVLLSAVNSLAQPHSWGYIDQNTGDIYSEQDIDEQAYAPSSESHHPIILFEANTSECRIGIDDRTLLSTGEADFVTAFNGNDFSCSVIPGAVHHEPCDALHIVPQNGSSFTFGVPPLGVDGPVIGGLFDHVKFLAYSINTTAPECGGSLSTTWKASGAQLNVDQQPFGSAVSNPNEDARLADVGLVVLDPDFLLTFDFIITNDIVYAIVERLPLPLTTYAAYTYLIPVYKRNPNVPPIHDIHKYESSYSRENHTMTWLIDGHPVLQINKFGVRLNEHNAFIFSRGKKQPLINPIRFKILEHGGIDTPVTPLNLQTGLSFFTLLDAYRPNNILGIDDAEHQALVRLESSNFRAPGIFFYYNPLSFDPILLTGPAGTFVQDSALNNITQQYEPTIPWEYRLFGQGAELDLYKYVVAIKDSFY